VFQTLFLVLFGNGSHFRAESQEVSHIDVCDRVFNQNKLRCGW
jgi:hypothetical protein